MDLLAAIDAASVSIEFIIFAFTREDIAQALIRAHERGVVVRGLIAPLFASATPAQLLTQAQVPFTAANVHSKLMIVDERLVITGSPNWSNNAWANNEASLFIDDAQVAQTYKAEFERASLP